MSWRFINIHASAQYDQRHIVRFRCDFNTYSSNSTKVLAACLHNPAR